MGVVRAAKEEGKSIKVIATETRPALQGLRLTAFEMMEDGFDVRVITDTMAGYVMSKGMVDKVLVGADRIVNTGHVFNKIGTYQIAILSEKHNIPFYPVAPSSTFDLLSRWDEVIIEERDPSEVVNIRDIQIAPKGVRALNPAFDMTPPELVTSIVSDRGILESPYNNSIIKNIDHNIEERPFI